MGQPASLRRRLGLPLPKARAFPKGERLRIGGILARNDRRARDLVERARVALL
jgi:hypothetical protein